MAMVILPLRFRMPTGTITDIGAKDDVPTC